MNVAKKSGGLVSAVAPVEGEMSPTREVEDAPPPPVPDAPVVRAPGGHYVVDVRREGVEVASGVFRLSRFVEGAEYVDSLNKRAIWSIGRNVHDNRVEAAIDARYYGDPNWECLWLR